MVFTRTWNASYEASPADSQSASQGATRIRELKLDVRERLAIDHSLAGDANDGAHNKVTLLEQASDPTNAANTGFIYTKDVSGATELFFEDHAGNITQLTDAGAFGPKRRRWYKGADIASTATLTLGSDGNFFDITGTTTITSINTVGIGTIVRLQFDDALTLTHHATDLILPGSANITTAAGDVAEFVEYATGDWLCTYYQRASGLLLVDVPFDNLGGFTSGSFEMLNADTERTTSSTSYILLKEFEVGFKGIINAYAEIKIDAGYTTSLDIRKNGASQEIHTTTSTSYAAKNTDITVVPGDNIEFYLKASVSFVTAYIQNARIRVASYPYGKVITN